MLRLPLCLWELNLVLEMGKWFISVWGERKAQLASSTDASSIFQKAINFVCHSYNLTDFFLWLMMAIVNFARYMLLSISYRKLVSHSFTFFISHPQFISLLLIFFFSKFHQRKKKYRLILVHSFHSFLCASHAIKQLASVYNFESTIIQYFYPSLCSISEQKGRAERNI